MTLQQLDYEKKTTEIKDMIAINQNIEYPKFVHDFLKIIPWLNFIEEPYKKT